MDIYHNPVRVLFGYGALDRLKGLVEETGARRVLVLTRGGEFEQTQPAQQIKEQLAEKIAMWIPYTVSNPDLADIAPVYQAASELDYDLVVAVGGGSVMDTGKFLSCFRGMGLQGVAELRQAVVSHSYCENHRRCPFIGISTTSGTSSELTPWAAIWDREKGLKYSIDHPSIFAYAAIIDPVLTLALPRRATVSTRCATPQNLIGPSLPTPSPAYFPSGPLRPSPKLSPNWPRTCLTGCCGSRWPTAPCVLAWPSPPPAPLPAIPSLPP